MMGFFGVCFYPPLFFLVSPRALITTCTSRRRKTRAVESLWWSTPISTGRTSDASPLGVRTPEVWFEMDRLRARRLQGLVHLEEALGPLAQSDGGG